MTEEQKFHYFDWASTSPSDNKILQEALEISQSAWANPSSIHAGGKEARTILESSREKCASVLGVKTEQIYFTSGGTESNHIPLLSVLNRPKKGTVLLSSIEHVLQAQNQHLGGSKGAGIVNRAVINSLFTHF